MCTVLLTTTAAALAVVCDNYGVVDTCTKNGISMYCSDCDCVFWGVRTTTAAAAAAAHSASLAAAALVSTVLSPSLLLVPSSFPSAASSLRSRLSNYTRIGRHQDCKATVTSPTSYPTYPTQYPTQLPTHEPTVGLTTMPTDPAWTGDVPPTPTCNPCTGYAFMVDENKNKYCQDRNNFCWSYVSCDLILHLLYKNPFFFP